MYDIFRLEALLSYTLKQVKSYRNQCSSLQTVLSTKYAAEMLAEQTSEVRSRPAWRQTIPRLNRCVYTVQ